jgi:hypothetical protein
MLSSRAARRGSLGFVSAAAEPFGGANKNLFVCSTFTVTAGCQKK